MRLALRILVIVATIAAALLYMGRSSSWTITWMRGFVRRFGHGAKHCATEAGRRALDATVKGCVRRFEVGLTIGKTRRGDMRSRELDALLGLPARAGKPSPVLSLAA